MTTDLPNLFAIDENMGAAIQATKTERALRPPM
jgi:hypothetical protein